MTTDEHTNRAATHDRGGGGGVKPEQETVARYWHGDMVVVPAAVAHWLLAKTNLSASRTATRGADPRRDAVLQALTIAAHQHANSASGSRPAAEPEVDPSSEWMSTRQASDLLRVSDRAVRYACQTGRLAAQQVAGRYRISRASLNQYRNRHST